MTLHLFTASIVFLLMGPVFAQKATEKRFDTNYLESCVQKQVQAHQNLKEVSQEHFRSYCECTAKKILNGLNSAQLNELNKGNPLPKWFKSAEESASKSCLKPISNTQV